MSPARESGSFVPPDQAVSDAPPAQERPENKRETLLEELDRNIGRVLELQTIVDQEMFAKKPDAALSRLRDFRESLWAGESDETIQLRDEWKQLTVRLQKLNNLENLEGDEDMTDEQCQDLLDGAEESKTIARRLAKIEGTDRLLYLLSLDRLSSTLEQKAGHVAEYENNEELLFKDAKLKLGNDNMEKLLDEEIDFEESVVKKKFDTFGVTLIMKPEFIQAIYSDSIGFHSEHSPFSYATERKEESEVNKTIEHERSHNIVDASVVEHGQLSEMIEKKYQRIKERKSIQDEEGGDRPTRLDTDERQLLLDVLAQPGRDIVNMLHDELLAEFSDLRVIFQKDGRALDTKMAMTFPLTKSPVFELFCDKASTAGWEARKYATILETIDKETRTKDWSDQKLAAAAAKASDDFGASLGAMLKHIVEVGELSKQYGSAAERDAQAALYVLRPSKYRHIPELLKHKYGSNTAKA